MFTSDQYDFEVIRITGQITDPRNVAMVSPPNPDQPHWAILFYDGKEIITTEPVTIHVRDKHQRKLRDHLKDTEEPLIQLGNDVDKDN